MKAAGKTTSLPRRAFRWCRIFALLLVAALLAVVLWSNYFSVPAPVTAFLRTQLRNKNVALNFERLRLSGFRRVLAEGLTIFAIGTNNTSTMQISRAELKLGYGGSLAEPLTISGLRLTGGAINLGINEPGRPLEFLSVTNLQADLEFRQNNRLRIVALSGEAFGVRANLSGVIRNFSSFRLAESATGRPSEWRSQLREVMEIAHQLSFAQPPELTLSFSADGKDIAKTRGMVNLRADAGTSRWGTFERLRVSSAVTPFTNMLRGGFGFALDKLTSDQISLGSIKVTGETEWSSDMQRLITNHVVVALADARTPWFTTPALEANLSSGAQNENIQSEFVVNAEQVGFSGNQLKQTKLIIDARHRLPFPTPARLLGSILGQPSSESTNRQEITGDWHFSSAHAKLARAEAESVLASGDITTRTASVPPGPGPSFWEYLRPFNLPWQLQLSNLTAGDVQIGSLAAKGGWSFPELNISEIDADLYKGKLSGHATLDVASRLFTSYAQTTFNYHDASVLLDPPVQKWIEQFAWESPPLVQTELSVQVPPWDKPWPELKVIVPTLSISGWFEGRGSFRGIPLGLAQSHFTFTNFVWQLPDLRITRPEGQAIVSYTGNVTNQQISARLESQINPAILASAVGPEVRNAFEFIRFSTPPIFRAEIRGDLDDPRTLEARGSLAASNFFAKEQAMSDLRTDFFYQDRKIELTDLVMHRGKEEAVAPYSLIDIDAGTMWVTNAISTIDPYIAMSIVGDETYDAIDPYRFANTPTVTINGIVPLGQVRKANLHFGVAGTDFSYWRFHLKELSGDVYWKGLDLGFSNVVAEFYGGRATWSGSFQIEEKTPHAQFSFQGTATDASLHPLIADLFGTTNRLEGIFSGDLTITSAHTSSILTWNGFGKAALKDGYLWSIPVFGIFTPTLESIAPGLGSTPVSSGAGNFTVTNSVIYTRDLQVKAPAFRLNYKGNVDLDGKLDARVEAELLRDAWVVGKIFSTALWPVSKAFEAQVSGKLNEPKTKFRFVPKFVFAPFKVVGAIAEAARRREGKAAEPPGKKE